MSTNFDPKDFDTKGHTFSELMEGGRKAKKMLDEGILPVEGSTKEDYMIMGDIAIYAPYIPLYVTGDIKNERD